MAEPASRPSFPTAETIAFALVVVARQLGEAKALRYATLSAGRRWYGALRSRVHVLAALQGAYPEVPLHVLAGWLGMPFAGVGGFLGQARLQRWYSETLVIIAFRLVAP
jgi:hypothetical protein